MAGPLDGLRGLLRRALQMPRRLLPPGIAALALIPGARSLWAAGGFDADAGEAILKYGA